MLAINTLLLSQTVSYNEPDWIAWLFQKNAPVGIVLLLPLITIFKFLKQEEGAIYFFKIWIMLTIIGSAIVGLIMFLTTLKPLGEFGLLIVPIAILNLFLHKKMTGRYTL